MRAHWPPVAASCLRHSLSELEEALELEPSLIQLLLPDPHSPALELLPRNRPVTYEGSTPFPPGLGQTR